VVQDGNDLADVIRSEGWDQLGEWLWAAAWPVVVALFVVGVAMVLVAWRMVT
jgi:hypothetical protein